MLEQKKSLTHAAWGQYAEHGEFRRSVEVGEGRIEIDANGNGAAHVYQDRFVAGGSTCIALLPAGVRVSGPLPDARTKPATHTAWAQYYEGGEFREWVEIGTGTIEVDRSGKSAACVFQNRFAAGGSTYICLLPIGVRPPDPPAKPKRPHEEDR